MNGLTKIEELEDTVSHLMVDLTHAHQQSAELVVRVKELEESLHYCNGTCDLAIKHRDAAGARIEELEAECFALKDALADTKPRALVGSPDWHDQENRRRSALDNNPGQPLLDRLHALETAQTACLGERDTALGQVESLRGELLESKSLLEIRANFSDHLQRDRTKAHTALQNAKVALESCRDNGTTDQSTIRGALAAIDECL